jgi:hypothetical protein
VRRLVDLEIDGTQIRIATVAPGQLWLAQRTQRLTASELVSVGTVAGRQVLERSEVLVFGALGRGPGGTRSVSLVITDSVEIASATTDWLWWAVVPDELVAKPAVLRWLTSDREHIEALHIGPMTELVHPGASEFGPLLSEAHERRRGASVAENPSTKSQRGVTIIEATINDVIVTLQRDETQRLFLVEPASRRPPLELSDHPQVAPVGHPPVGIAVAGRLDGPHSSGEVVALLADGTDIPGQFAAEGWLVMLPLRAVLNDGARGKIETPAGSWFLSELPGLASLATGRR